MKKYYYYQITNKLNNKKYIGITTNISERINKHFNELRRNAHHSMRLQNAWNKYGEDNFEFQVIDQKYFSNFLEAQEYEISLIHQNNSKENGYNMTDSHSPMLNPEIAMKVKLSNQAKVHDIIQIDLKSKNKINQFKSLREAERKTGIPRQNIKKVCDRNQIKAGEYYWAYEKDFNDRWIPKLNGKNQPVGVIENNKIIKVYDSAAHAARELGLDRSNIRSSIFRNGSTGGIKFQFLTHDEYYKFFEACRDYS